MIRCSYDQDGLTLEFKSRQSLLGRLLSRQPDRNLDHDTQLGFALADLRATAEEAGEEVEIGASRIRLKHRTLGEVDKEAADALGFPPLVDLTLRTDVLGQIGSPNFQLTYEWLRAGKPEIVTRTGAILDTPNGPRRLPRWILDALEVADQFQAGPADLDAHWEALAHFRRALEPGIRLDRTDTEARLRMTEFLSGLEVTLTDRFAISPQGEDQFAIIPFLGETVEAIERDGRQINEAGAELQEGRLRAFQDKAFARGARPAYKIGNQSYLVVDPDAAPVLRVMTEMQRADKATRAAFVKNPRQRITEAVTEHLRTKGELDGLSPAQEEEIIEQTAEPAFVETLEYSERVIGLTRYVKPGPEFLASGTTWLPEVFTGAAAEKIGAMPPDKVEELIQRVDAAIAEGDQTVAVDGVEIPATPASRTVLVQRLKETGTPEEPKKNLVIEDEMDATGGPVILDTRNNIADLQWYKELNPRTRLAPDTLPKVVKSAIKEHQIESFHWKLEAWTAGLPGILNADEQGLGKTLQAITFLAWMKENMSRSESGRTAPVLVVAPTSLLVNWEEEVDKHLNAPGLGNVIRLYGSCLGNRKRPGQKGKDTDRGITLLNLSDVEDAIKEGRGHRYWILTTYTTLANYQHSLARIPFSTAVFDEIQAVKNPGSLRAKAALTVNADFRIGLTGTPIKNSTTDLWAIMDQLIPGRFGSLKEFREMFGNPEQGNMRELYMQMFEWHDGHPPVGLRRLKENVARDLPGKSRCLHPRLMPESQAATYEEAHGKLAAGIRGAALKMLQHIRSVSVHPNASSPAEDKTFIGMSARLFTAMDIIRKIRDRGERVLVFIENVQIQHRFIGLLKQEFGLPQVNLINGSTPIPRRQEIVNQFQRHLKCDEGFEVLVLGPRAAGTGLTLTAATNVIHLSRWWNPAVEEQCNDRVHRIGQTRDVTVHIPMAIHPGYQHNSFDCLLHSLMTRKRRLASSALWPMGDTEEDVNRLQQMLLEGSLTQAKDPVNAAMVMMFKRDGIPMEPPNPDGSIPYL